MTCLVQINKFKKKLLMLKAQKFKYKVKIILEEKRLFKNFILKDQIICSIVSTDTRQYLLKLCIKKCLIKIMIQNKYHYFQVLFLISPQQCFLNLK